MVDEATLPAVPGEDREVVSSAPALEVQGPAYPTKASFLIPRDPNWRVFDNSAEPLREEQGPPMPERSALQRVIDWGGRQKEITDAVLADFPLVSAVQSVHDHWGLKPDPDYDPAPDIEGTEWEKDEQFLTRAAFVHSRGEMEVLKESIRRERANAEVRSQNPIASLAYGLLFAPSDPMMALPAGAVYRAGKLGIGAARSAMEGAAWGAAGGLASESILQQTQYTRTREDYLGSALAGAVFGGGLGASFSLGGSMLDAVLGRAVANMGKKEFDAVAKRLDAGITPGPIFHDFRERAIAAGEPAERADALAAFNQVHYEILGEKLGRDPLEVYQEARPDIQKAEAPEALGEEQLGQFAGPRAGTADPAKLANAEDMERRGWDKDAVWMATGWGRGADGKWRFEIPDDLKGIGADVPDRLRAIPAGHGVRLRELYRNPDLEKAYPQVFDLPVATTSRGDGAFDEKAGIIWLNPEAPVEQVRLALIHEIQHAIQAEEGFARGSNSRVAGASTQAASGRMAGAAEKVQARVALLGESPESAAAFVAKHERLDADELAQWAWKTPDELRAIRDENRPAEVYRRNAGEVEARNTEARSAMSGEERLSSPPWDTEDVPRERQIVREGDDRFYQSLPEQGFLGEAQGKVIDDTLSGASKDKPVLFPSTPKVFTALGVKDTPVVLPPSVIWKAVDKHHLTPEEIKGAVDALSNPVMVFDSATSPHSLVALVDVPGSQKPIVVALHHNEKVGRTEIARIASIHERNPPGQILNWMTQGLTRYFNKWKAGAWVRSRGLQLPKDGSPRNRQGLRVLQHRDIFNSELKQAGEGAPRGAITFQADARALIQLFRDADASTLLHETGHLWLKEMIRYADQSPDIKADLDKVLDWFGVKDASQITTEHHEMWARGFEQYLMSGKAPRPELKGAFDQFRHWLSSIYKALTDLGEPIPDEIRSVMDRMLATDAHIETYRESLLEPTGGLGGSGGAAYRYEDDNLLKGRAARAGARISGGTPLFGSPIARLTTSPFAAVRRAAEWLGDSRMIYEKNAVGVPTAVDQATGLRGNLDDVRRFAHAYVAKIDRTVADFYSQYRFGRSKRVGDGMRKLLPDPAHLDSADFRDQIGIAMNMGDKHDIPEVQAAARELRKVADDYLEKAVEAGIWKEPPGKPNGAESYFPHIFDIKKVIGDRKGFIDDAVRYYASEQRAKAPLKARLQELAQQRDELEVRARKLQRRMETVDRQEQELAARTSERGMEARRAGRRSDQLDAQATGAAEQATSLNEFVGAVKADLNSPEARAEIDDLRAQAREMTRLAKPRTQADIARAARFERDAVLSGVRLAAEIVIGRKRSYEPPSFLRWIARQGGVSDPNGTLMGSDIGLRGVILVKGRSFDQLGERIAEEAGGLLPGRPGANEVEDWIVQAARGEEPGWWTARHLDAEHAGQSRVAQEIQQMAAERGVTLHTLDDVATFLRGEEGRPQTLEDLERRVAGEEGMRSEGMTGGALAEEARQALAGALGDRASARAAVRDAMVALAGVRRRMGRAETKAEEALRALTANKDRMETLSDRAIDLSVRRQMLEAAMANHEAEAAALRGKMEEVVAAWNGNSSKGAKRALEKRASATEGMPADAPRNRAADPAVEEAIHRILNARTDLTEAELRERAGETWGRIVATPAGRFAYDGEAEAGELMRSGKADLSGRFQERKFAMPFADKQKWLDLDPVYALGSMVRSMEMDIALAKRLDGIDLNGPGVRVDLSGTKLYRDISDEAQRHMDAFAGEFEARNGRAPTQVEIAANNNAVVKRRDEDIQYIMNMIDRQRGTFGVSGNKDTVALTASRLVRAFNVWVSLGSAALSSITDLAVPLLRHALVDLLGSGWVPFVSGIRSAGKRRANEELRLFGVGLEAETNARIADLNEILDDFGHGTKLERAFAWTTSKFMSATGLLHWTDMGERVVGYVTMTKVLKAAQAAAEGRMKPGQLEMLADLGIDEHTARRIWGEFANGGGEKFRGLWLTHTEQWADRGAAEAMRIAVGRGVERSIVRPGQERPFWTDQTEYGRMLFQFKSFMVATTQTVMVAGLQQSAARIIIATAAMVGLGAIQSNIRAILQGREPTTDPTKLAIEGASASGLLGWLDMVNDIAEKASFGHVGLSALTGDYAPRYANVNLAGQMFGPTVGKIVDVGTASGKLAADALRRPGEGRYAGRADISALRRSLLPGQNHFLLRYPVTALEDALGNAMGFKPRKRTLKVGTQ